jgi:hypothetical protein
MSRWLTWISDHQLRGWACSQCDWNFPVPSLLQDKDAKSAYDRLAASKFQDHDCATYPKRQDADEDSFAERARRLILRGFKPKDAVEIVLQEIMLEYRNDPTKVAKARIEAEGFLRSMKDSLT